MINTTIAYKRAINGNRVFRVQDKITFKNQDPLQLSINDFMSYSINDATSSSGKFDIGAAVMKEYSAVLNNETGKFDWILFALFLAFNLADWITGWMKSRIAHKENSKTGWKGVLCSLLELKPNIIKEITY